MTKTRELFNGKHRYDYYPRGTNHWLFTLNQNKNSQLETVEY